MTGMIWKRRIKTECRARYSCRRRVASGEWRVAPPGLSSDRTENNTHRCMCRLMIYMHEGALHVRQHLDLVLELLADVVRFPQRRIGRHDDVDFDEVILNAVKDGFSKKSSYTFCAGVLAQGCRSEGGDESRRRTGPLCSIIVMSFHETKQRKRGD